MTGGKKKDDSLAGAMRPRREAARPVSETFKRPGVVEGETLQTSVRLPLDLHNRARYYSIDSGISLNLLIVEGLQMRLDRED